MKIKITVEELILVEFRKQAEHLRLLQATPEMQRELLTIARPFHRKFLEMGYAAEVSRVMIRKAFDHNPQNGFLGLFKRKPKLTVLEGPKS